MTIESKEENKSSMEPPVKETEWGKLMSYLLFLSGMDIAMHYQLLSHRVLNFQGSSDNKTIPESQGYLQLAPSHCLTASVLFYSSIVRILLLIGCFKLCQRKSIPKLVQPYLHYVTMTTTFTFCSITMWRLLVDSEPPNHVLYRGYTFLMSTDIGFSISEYIFCKYIVKTSGAVTKTSEDEKDKEKKKSKKDDDDDEKEERTVPFFVMMRKLSVWYKSEWRLIASGYVLLLFGISGSSIESLLSSKIIDAINSPNPMDLIPHGVLMLTICQLIERVTMTFRDCLADIVGARVSVKAKSELYKKILEQEVGFFDQTKSGKILRKIGTVSSDMEQVWRSLERNIRAILYLVGATIAMMTMSWRLSIIIVMGAYVLWLPNNMLKNFYTKRWQRIEKVITKSSNMASESVRNIKTVKSFANEDMESERYNKKLHECYILNQQDRLAAPILCTFERISWLSVRATVLLYGGHLMMIEQLTPGQLVTFLLYMEHVWGYFRYLVDWEALRFWKMLLNMEIFFEYIERRPNVDMSGKYICDDKLLGKIEFKDVSFHYPTRPESQILKGISFTVEPGQVVALVGASGSGKSTCVSLLQRFYDPTTGQVMLDGKPIHCYDNKFLHKEISIVSQEPVLFGCSIEENIKYGNPDATQEDVVQAAKDANAHDFISALDDGYETDVGEAGSQMSGGQKQRIAIARALITKPRIMLLDEATSALDAESERLVQEALQNSMKGRTVVVIAHRLSTIEHADKIVVFDKGKVVEQGSHEALLSTNGVYSRLVRKQLKKPKPLMIEELMKETDEESSSQDSGYSQKGSDDEDVDI